ncbi:MAG: heme exporter protein CcmB, partial [Acetobacter orientalis]
MTRLFCAIVLRDLKLALRHGADTLGAVLFFILTGTLFPLALGPSPELLRHMAPGIIWVCALLAALLPLDRLFGAELEDGSLDQLLLLGLPAPLVALAKMTAHWLTTGLPLLIAAIPLATMLGLPAGSLPILLAGLLLGSMVLSLTGGMGASIV